MPRKSSKVKITYQPASKTPSERKPYEFQTEMRQPQPLSPLKQYIADNEESGLTMQELVEQFQEYDCPHPAWSVSLSAPSYKMLKCDACGKLVKKVKSGV